MLIYAEYVHLAVLSVSGCFSSLQSYYCQPGSPILQAATIKPCSPMRLTEVSGEDAL